MSHLTQKLRRLAEFDELAFADVYQPINKNDEIHDGIYEGARWENSRLLPLITVLLECVEALDHYEHVGLPSARLGDPREIYYAREALAKLSALVIEQKSGGG